MAKNQFRGAAPKDPFYLGKQSERLSPYAPFRFAKERALRVDGTVFQTGHPFYRAGLLRSIPCSAAGADSKDGRSDVLHP